MTTTTLSPVPDIVRTRRAFALVALAAVAWIALYLLVPIMADWFAYSLLKLAPDSRLGESVAYFLEDVPKILLLLSGMVFLISVIRTFFSPERTRAILGAQTGRVYKVD
jgi:uncharacterized protein